MPATGTWVTLNGYNEISQSIFASSEDWLSINMPHYAYEGDQETLHLECCWRPSPRGDRQAVKGKTLVLVCSVAEGTEDATFSWYREDTGEDLGRKSQHFRRAELEILAVMNTHEGGHCCTADNGHGLLQSESVNVTMRIPVSRPLLTFISPGLHWGRAGDSL
ncbi:hypothetical protein MC885_017354 [Smutsia gigantea]|nr:hypothetical protein MC885_017354 [Smutsia gigantea]